MRARDPRIPIHERTLGGASTRASGAIGSDPITAAPRVAKFAQGEPWTSRDGTLWPMLVVRTITTDEIDAVSDLTARIFASEEEYDGMFQITRAAYQSCPFMSLDLCFVGETEGRLVAKWQVLDFSLRIAGVEVKVGGIQGVVAEPDENHKGYPKQIAMEALPRVREMDYDILLGYAQRGAFYRKLGAVPLHAEYELEVDARQVPRLDHDPYHAFDEATELSDLMRIYNARNVDRSASMIRSEALWPWMVRRPPIVLMGQDGYIGLRDGGDKLEVREIHTASAAESDVALRKIAAVAREHGYSRIVGRVPADHGLVRSAVAHGAQITTKYSKKSGALALCIAPVRLIERIAGSLEARLHASVYADTRVELEIRSGFDAGHLTLNAGGRDKREAVLNVSPGAAMQLAAGYRAVGDVLAGEANDASPPVDAQALHLLETLFPMGHPYLWATDRY